MSVRKRKWYTNKQVQAYDACPVTDAATNPLTSVTIPDTYRESRSVKDAFGRGYSRKRSECGARARKDTVRSRAASGIMLFGTTADAGGAFPGLGQVGAGNARLANAMATASHGSLAWS
jgi:hypothetical protein